MKFLAWLRNRLFTADSIYGLILYSALIGGVSDDDSAARDVLVISLASLLVFWAAHVFAGTVTKHGADTHLPAAFSAALGESVGMLYAVVLPSIPLVLSIAGFMTTDDATTASLVIAMIILGVLGYEAFRRRGSSAFSRVLGALGTAAFGFVVILLNGIAH